MFATNDDIDIAAKVVVCWPTNRKWKSKDQDKRVRALFGAPLNIIADIWNMIWKKLSNEEKKALQDDGVEFKHLLYALVFLKIYSTEEAHCSICDWPSGRTFRKWSWYFVSKIAELEIDVIKLKNRFGGYKRGDKVHTNCFISVDCTDCPIYEPYPFDKKWFSHKFNGPALKYEVAVCIKTGFIVWINGPFAGSKSDQSIFKDGLSKELAADEAVEADAVYNFSGGVAAMQVKTPAVGWNSEERKEKSVARSRNERINGKLKTFNVLTTFFRHSKPREEMTDKHRLCFTAVAVITQLKIEAGETVDDYSNGEFNVNYF